MRRVLVTGASGFLGYNLCLAMKGEWEVFGTWYTHPVTIDGVRLIQTDLRDLKALRELFKVTKPDVVVHTAAVSDPNLCQTDPLVTRGINVDASIAIAGLCGEFASRCLFTSTDLVFDGKNAPYREEDPVCPLSHYGEQKVLAEEGMVRCNPETVVCRMPLMFGNPGPAARSFIQPMLEAARERRELKLFTDEYRTPLSGEAACDGLAITMSKGSGLIHLGGPERISRFEFGRLLFDIFRLKGAHPTACLQRDLPMAAPRPADVSLDSSKAAALGFKPPSLRAQLERLRMTCFA